MDSTEQRRHDAVTQSAARWFVAHRGGPLSMQDRQAFGEWLRESPVHVREYLAVASTARGFRDVANLTDVDLPRLIEEARGTSDETVFELQRVDRRVERTRTVKRAGWARRFRQPLGWTLAAGIAALAILVSPWVLREVNQLRGIELLQTAHGEQRVWRLADGSIVYLNSGSKLEVRFNDEDRTIDVAQGQALFEVAHERRRFRVRAGDTQVVALGTVFDVYRKPDATLVTVVQGKVIVYEPKTTAANSRNAPRSSVRVAAGEQIRVASARPLPTPKRVDPSGAVAWRQQKIVFDQERLADVAEEFNRYGRVPISIEDAALGDIRISGNLNAYDTESFLAFIDRLKGVDVRVEQHVIRAVAESRGLKSTNATKVDRAPDSQ